MDFLLRFVMTCTPFFTVHHFFNKLVHLQDLALGSIFLIFLFYLLFMIRCWAFPKPLIAEWLHLRHRKEWFLITWTCWTIIVVLLCGCFFGSVVLRHAALLPLILYLRCPTKCFVFEYAFLVYSLLKVETSFNQYLIDVIRYKWKISKKVTMTRIWRNLINAS